MKAADALSKDARALLRAARGGHDITAAERQRVLQAFRERAALADAVDQAAANAPRFLRARSGQRRALPRPVPRFAWALAAVISTGSLAALAREGAFEGWGAAIERMLGTLAGESSTGGVEPAVKESAARGVPPSVAPKQRAEAVAGEPTRAADEPVRAADEPVRAAGGSSSDAKRASEPTSVGVSSAGTAPVRAPRTSAAPSREPARAVTAELAASRVTPPAADPSASAELNLIVMARNALATRRHADARAAAERHALQFPRGVFSEEREAILALCACREAGASERARAFIEGRPGSLFAERIRQDCKLDTNLVPGAPAAGTHQASPPRSGGQ